MPSSFLIRTLIFSMQFAIKQNLFYMKVYLIIVAS